MTNQAHGIVVGGGVVFCEGGGSKKMRGRKCKERLGEQLRNEQNELKSTDGVRQEGRTDEVEVGGKHNQRCMVNNHLHC